LHQGFAPLSCTAACGKSCLSAARSPLARR
jgi:hypothetical protein